MNKGNCSKRISYSVWRLHTLRRIFLSTKDIGYSNYYTSRSFSNGPKLLFARSLRGRANETDISTKTKPSKSHQTGSKVITLPGDQNTHESQSPSASGSHLKNSNSKKNAATAPRNTKIKQKDPSSIPPNPQSRSLPQSPLLNPKNEDEPLAKQRKRQPTKDDIDRLRHNPWAMALASSVRNCSATTTRLPREFMLDWGLVRHPEAKNSWFMPKSLLADEIWEAAQVQSEQEAESAGKIENKEGNSEGRDTSASQRPKPAPKTDIRSVTQSPKFYILNRASVQKDLTAPSNQSKQQPTQMIPYKWKYPSGTLRRGDMRSLVWREDMPEFVLGALRRAAVKTLKRACLKSVNMEDTGGVWRVIQVDGDAVDEKTLSDGLTRIGGLERMGSGAVLVFGPDRTAGKKVSGVAADNVKRPTPLEAAVESSLPDLISLPSQGSQVPVFDLTALLSESDIGELRQHHPRFQETALFFRPGVNIPVDAILALWKLKGYVIYDKDIIREA